ncbi:MAG: hypothetical protein K5761_07055 [Clostridiales bacterium]|nr:hypothetical protein [Clostridiales bacterium]
MKKKILSVLITGLLIIQIIPINISAANKSDLYGVWKGTYDGSDNGEIVQRKIRLDIDYVSGEYFEGVATLENGGSYFFDGTLSDDGSISFEGSDWIENPENWGICTYSGKYSAGKMTGNVDNDENMNFSFTKTSDSYITPRVNIKSIPKEWDGEYDGSHEGTVVRRVYEIHIRSISDDGKIRGDAIIAPSEKSDSIYGANGSYYFGGEIDLRRGTIKLQGDEWIEYPDSSEYDSWSFIKLNGRFDLSKGKAAIHGESEYGIWEMTAIDYSSINYLSGFTLAKDNNNFVHTSSDNWDGAGFKGVENYYIDNSYFKKLTRNSSQGEKNRIKKNMYDHWEGSCYGIAMSMGLLYEGYIDIDDLTDSEKISNYYSLSYPCDDEKLLNMINYYQLSQGLENGGKNSAAVSVTYNNGIFTDLVNWYYGYDSIPVFLKKLVNYCETDHVELLGFSTSEGGHAVLITGCKYDKKSDSYQVQIYDENCIDSPSNSGEFIYMTVAKDYSSFSFTDSNGELINNKTYKSMYFLDWNSMGNVITSTSDSYSKRTKIRFPMDQCFSIRFESGEELEYDGEKFKGSIPIYGIDTAEYKDVSYYIVETSEIDSMTINCSESEAIDIETFNDEGLMAFRGESIDSADIDLNNGIELHGDDYSFEAFVTTDEISEEENGLISISGEASSDVSLSVSGTSVDVSSDNEISGVSTAAYIGNERITKQYNNVGDGFTINDDATIDGADEVEETESPLNTDKNEPNEELKKIIIIALIVSVIIVVLTIVLIVLIIKKKSKRKQ